MVGQFIASYMRSCFMKPEFGSTWGRDWRIRCRALSSVKGWGGRETISGVVSDGEVLGCCACRECQRR